MRPGRVRPKPLGTTNDTAVNDSAARLQGVQDHLHLVGPHQLTETNNIGNDDRRQLSLDVAQRTAFSSSRSGRPSPPASATMIAASIRRFRSWAIETFSSQTRTQVEF